MPRVSQQPDDFRRVLREKALSHSLFYLKLSSAADSARPAPAAAARPASAPGGAVVAAPAQTAQRASESARAPPIPRVRRARARSARVSALVRHFDSTPDVSRPMQYLRPPRGASPASDDTGDICSSDDEDRRAVRRRRSRDLSDDSAVELEPRPRPASPPPESPQPRRERTLVEAQFVELGAAGERRGSDGGWEARGRCVRTPSVVVSDYSDGASAGATPEEAAWLRARALSADSACSSCSTLSSRDDDELDSPPPPPPPLLTKKVFRQPTSSSDSRTIHVESLVPCDLTNR